MTRISAGSTLANQYAPPFVVSDSVTTNWQLRWNATLLAFEAYDPDALVVSAGFDTIEQQLFSNVTNQQIFILPWVAASEQSLYITINGVKQHTDTYTIIAGSATTTVTLGGTATGDVEFIGLQASGGAVIELFNFTAVDDVTTDFTLSWLAPSEQSLLVTINGLRQHTDTYSIVSNAGFTATIISLGDPLIESGATPDVLEIVGITTTGEIPSSPVNASNLGAGTGIFGAKRQIGEEQILDFKSLVAGSANITITNTVNDITIDSIQPTFQNIGTGTALAVDPNVTTPLQLRVLKTKTTAATAEGGLALAIDADLGIVVTRNFGYLLISSDDYNMDSTFVGERIIGLDNFTATKTITLPPIASIRAGETITIKDEIGGASATFTVTIDTVGAETIDTVASIIGINSAFGYVTLYSNGTNFFKIAEG